MKQKTKIFPCHKNLLFDVFISYFLFKEENPYELIGSRKTFRKIVYGRMGKNHSSRHGTGNHSRNEKNIC